jgi:hypothetical protein
MQNAVMFSRYGGYIIKYPAVPPIERDIYRRRWDRLRWMEGAQRAWNHRRKPLTARTRKPRTLGE